MHQCGFATFWPHHLQKGVFARILTDRRIIRALNAIFSVIITVLLVGRFVHSKHYAVASERGSSLPRGLQEDLHNPKVHYNQPKEPVLLINCS
jgi:hypothetical protein